LPGSGQPNEGRVSSFIRLLNLRSRLQRTRSPALDFAGYFGTPFLLRILPSNSERYRAETVEQCVRHGTPVDDSARAAEI
jgi:hypothetical protein